ncbi:iron-sulfur cluster assembly scaffold protein [Mycoplasmopsis citelli]|uniref:iron-sulfur cluster assembly scaffold protein n=1 Tax=Mycoplasmopsis citelli TaxID=171281 RepID=UPI0021158C52|nr:iron-sulfur cluster assembly scaffold protein [Mycoplasmopsis citelli]UUD36610.1 iron-sulfur cluster assembly scaffold protein [Mycoplasmopsis citelli]
MDFNANKAREIIMNHYLDPENKKPLSVDDGEVFFSSTCSDKLILHTKFKDKKLIEASFDGHGCAIFIAASDILLSLLKNKNIDEIEQVLLIYQKFIIQEELSNEQINLLGDLWVFYNVKTHLNRTTCALLTAEKILKN